MQITTIGLDLAKSVFQVHGVGMIGKAVVAKPLRRDPGSARLTAFATPSGNARNWRPVEGV